HGWDFVNGDNDPRDDHWHGTHVAGIVGATGNNRRGVVGVNWRVTLLPIKFLDSEGAGSAADAVHSIEYAIQMGARVINASWSGPAVSEAVKEAIEAADRAGILFVAAAGNAGSDNEAAPVYPANYDVPNVISVAATND